MKKVKTYKPVDPYKDLYISVAIFGIVFALTVMIVMSLVVYVVGKL